MKRHSKSITILYNPRAGFFKQRFFKKSCSLLRKRGYSLTIEHLIAFEELDNTTLRTLQRKDEIVLIAGGDGTIHHAINSFLKHDWQSYPIFGILPTGTANVIAIGLGLDTSPQNLYTQIQNRKTKTVHLFQINDQHMIQMASIGFDAEIVRKTPDWLKAIISKGAYVVTAIIQLFQTQKSYKIEIDGKSYTAQQIIIMNSQHYAGNFCLAPQADLSNSQLSIILLKKITLGMLARFIMKIIRGNFSNTDDMSFLKAKKVSFKDLPSKTPLQIDGESFEISTFRFHQSKEIKMIAINT